MEGRTYRYFRGKALYEFGYGLSYTNFSYSELQLPGEVSSGASITVSATVTNTGTRDGREVVQLYISDEEASVPVPIRSLAGIKSLELKAGESQTVSFVIEPDQLALIDKDYKSKVEAGKFLVSVGGSQPGQKALKEGRVLSASLVIKD
jgi:beta-glucosidase